VSIADGGYTTKNNKKDDLNAIIERLHTINPHLAYCIRHIEIPNVIEQATAIEQFYSGRLSYAEMRMIAG
jgi:hypothetical protein